VDKGMSSDMEMARYADEWETVLEMVLEPTTALNQAAI